MGLKLKLLAVFIGLASLSLGAWLLGLICFLFFFITIWPRRSLTPTAKSHGWVRISPRQALGLLLLFLSAVAIASGGVFSPFVFFLTGASILMWPAIIRKLPLGELVPMEGSILLRSRFLPVLWCAVAELKPGSEEFPKAASSFAGRFLLFTDTGKVYSIATCFAAGRKLAEAETLDRFRRAAPSGRAGAFLLPLDSVQAADVLRPKLTRVKFPLEKLADSASRVSGAIVLESDRRTVQRAAVFEIEGKSATPSIPARPVDIESPPLTWEVFDTVGKRTRWPQPDQFSNLLDSMLATRGVPMAERVRELETSGDQVKIQSLSGEEICTTRTQLRALVSIYS